jgi:hypothetical protein
MSLKLTNSAPLLVTKLINLSMFSLLPLIIIALGIILRLREYIANRSLWVDEALLALNIIKRPFLELLKPLSDSQHAPIGFLWLERFSLSTIWRRRTGSTVFPAYLWHCLAFSLQKNCRQNFPRMVWAATCTIYICLFRPFDSLFDRT